MYRAVIYFDIKPSTVLGRIPHNRRSASDDCAALFRPLGDER